MSASGFFFDQFETMSETIAIQGIKGSFHHQVAQEYFGKDVKVRECMSFRALIESMSKGEATSGVMAIENSIAGSILPNFALIDVHDMKITGEHYIPIHMNLMALHGQVLSEIQEVYSHPIALLQCKDFFEAHPHIKLVEDTDTAEVARRISEGRLQGVGAVAGEVAGTLYHLETLAEGIQSVKNNATRFLVISPGREQLNQAGTDKASLKFELDHSHGSLASVLNILNDCNLNLTKIQSLPIIETPWRYSFFIDVTYGSYAEYQKAIKILEVMTKKLKILGEYKNNRA